VLIHGDGRQRATDVVQHGDRIGGPNREPGHEPIVWRELPPVPRSLSIMV